MEDVLLKIKALLYTELENAANETRLTSTSLDEIDKILHSLKNVCKLLKTEESVSEREHILNHLKLIQSETQSDEMRGVIEGFISKVKE